MVRRDATFILLIYKNEFKDTEGNYYGTDNWRLAGRYDAQFVVL